jgi:HCOMODA/2-hydroxy-3-carboxy-muconic semialdehyde decarboxylase
MPVPDTDLDTLLNHLVIANRTLAHENVVDAYGHVSVRNPHNPERFFIARSLAPEFVTRDDLVELDLSGEPTSGDGRALYLERFIHAGVYAARPEVNAVVHAHAEATLPYCVATDVPLRPVIHSGSFIGAHVPLWDIADEFGDTNLLVENIAQGRSLAATLGADNVVLMRGHGFTAAARSLIEVVRIAIYLPRNAQVQTTALSLGGTIRGLTEGEITARNSEAYAAGSVATQRAWHYWATRCGCAELL